MKIDIKNKQIIDKFLIINHRENNIKLIKLHNIFHLIQKKMIYLHNLIYIQSIKQIKKILRKYIY
jgi:hypothetical protein